MLRLVRAGLPGLAAIVLALALAAPLGAKGQLEVVAKFQQASLELDLATYVDPEFAAPGNRMAVLGFATGPVRNSFTLRPDDWTSLTDLWAKAARMQSRNWRPVGSLTEKSPGDPARLTVSAGLGVKIGISSPKGASMTYLVGKADMPRFEAALSQVRDLLAR
jgi:hypothetical protein